MRDGKFSDNYTIQRLLGQGNLLDIKFEKVDLVKLSFVLIKWMVNRELWSLWERNIWQQRLKSGLKMR